MVGRNAAYRFVIAACIFCLGTGAARAQDNALTPKESSEGWTLLFDGKTIKGWEARPTSEPNSKGDWKVENGSLVCGGTTPSWLHTNATFSDFVLTLEFRGSEKVNSGVFLRSQKEGEPHRTGYELQIWDYQPAGFNTGSLVGSLKASPTKIKPDAWNRYDITADGDRFLIVLNGKILLDARDSMHKAGVIGFQCQKDQRIEFRNIKLRAIRK
jgi:hypothetical protein